MLRRWLFYAVCLFCGFLFYIFSPGYLSYFLLVVLVLLPILSLLLTLPGYFGLSLAVEVAAAQLPRGSSASVKLVPCRRGGRLCRVRFSWTAENLLYPQLTQSGRRSLTVGDSLLLPLPCDHCGWLRFSVTRFALEDWMGLFCLRRKAPQPVLILLRPLDDPSGLPDWADRPVNAPLQPRPGGGPGEEYELRDYRPGDPVQSIHWKLTAKQPEGDPILRETLEPVQDSIVVTYDHFGPPGEVDRTLDRLCALAASLLERPHPFSLRWTHPDTGAVTIYPVACGPDWERTLSLLLARSAPLTPTAPVKETPPLVRRGNTLTLHLSGKEEGQE